MKQVWISIVERAIELGVLPEDSDKTVSFHVIHQHDCAGSFVHWLLKHGYYFLTPPEESICDCKPIIFWRKACDPLDQFNIIVDRSNSMRGLI